MIRSFQWDLARQVERLDWLLAQLPRYAAWGYEELHLHLEDAVEYPSLPGVARKDAYSYKQFARLVEAATRVGIKVVPIVNLLGHTQYLIKAPELRDLNELRASDGSPLERGQICPLHPRTLEVAEKLLRDMAPFCTAGKVHVGLDESYHLGKCPRCQKQIREIGLGAHFAKYVGRLHSLTERHKLRMGLWADMFYFIPEAIPLLPPGITAYEWYYFPFKRWPRVELYNFAEADIATPLHARGIALYGCPMNGAFRHEPVPPFQERLANIVSWWRHAKRIGAEGFLITSWEPSRLAIELTTVVDAAAASLWLNPGVTEPLAMLRLGCERVYGKRGKSAFAVLRQLDQFPFSGYATWQINERWDTVATSQSLAPFRKTLAGLRRIRSRDAEPAIKASLQFRTYLAQRDLFVREAGQAVLALRRSFAARRITELLAASRRCETNLSAGLRAAQSLWTESRSASTVSPNVAILREDRARLRAWQSWLRRCRTKPDHRFQPSPVLGAWQVLITVRNFAPALQKLVIEQRDANGAWVPLHGLFSIEFKAAAAKPRTNFIQHMSAPVTWSGSDEATPSLRLVVRGFGQLAAKDVALFNGVRTLRARNTQRWKVLGEPAPGSGFPEFDWAKDRDSLELDFRGADR